MSLAWKVMLPLGVLNFLAVAILTELAAHAGPCSDDASIWIVCLVGWGVMLVGWAVVAMARPLITDNRPRAALGRFEIDSQI